MKVKIINELSCFFGQEMEGQPVKTGDAWIVYPDAYELPVYFYNKEVEEVK